jgi:predicted Zn-dependent protease
VGGYNQGGVANARGPITGADYADWANRLRTVQNLIDDPQLRQQVANALAQADDLRRNYTRHSQLPQWNLVMDNVMSPLAKVSTALKQQLAHIDQPDSLQPVDQDPVPEKYADAVKKYYEALGN